MNNHANNISKSVLLN